MIQAINYENNNCESRRTLREWTWCEMVSHNNSMMALYSETLVEEGHKHTPPKDNTWLVGV